MNPRLTITSAVVAAALGLAVAPAGAQSRRDSGQQRAGARTAQGASAPRQDRARQAPPRSSESRQSSAPRAVVRGSEARQPAAPQMAPRSSENRQSSGPQVTLRGNATRQNAAPQMAPRSSENRQSAAPSVTPRGNATRQYAAPQMAPRSSGNRQSQGPAVTSRGNAARPGGAPQMASPGYGSAQAGPRAVPRNQTRSPLPGPRPNDNRGYSQPRGYYGSSYSRPYVRPLYFEPYRPFYFSRSYYTFRPRLSIGFGLWLGYSVSYPWAYFGTYRPRVYGYYPSGYYGVSPSLQYYGGLSFDVQPSDADLWVDGEYVGMVGTFTPYGEPLTLYPGVHRIAIVREGFQTIEWDVTVEPGVVFPFRGTMVPW